MAKCNFGDQLDTQLRDRVVAGISHAELQKKLLLTKDLNFQLAQQIREQYDDVSAATTTTAHCLLAGDRGKKYVSSSSRNREQYQSKSYNQEQKRSDVVPFSTPKENAFPVVVIILVTPADFGILSAMPVEK